MTTPAKNVNTVVTEPQGYWQRQISPYGPEVFHSLGNLNVSWIKDICPASGTSPLTQGFRKCRAWDHRVSKLQWLGSECTVALANQRYRYPRGSYWGGSRSPPSGGPILPSANLINWTLVEALNRLKAQDVHIGNFLAEGQKTADLIGSTAKQIATSVTNYRRITPLAVWNQILQHEGHVARENWCLIPSSWLQLQYGWKPLLSDVYGAINHLKKRERFSVAYVSARAHKSNTVKMNSTTTGGDRGGSCTWSWQSKQDVWVNLVYGLLNPILAELSSLGLINPAEIVWETMRYSFVVDWFLPIGPWMGSLTANVGYSFITGSLSQKAELTNVGTTVAKGSTPGVVYESLNPAVYAGRDVLFQRTCYTSSPVPGLYVKSPISLDHMLNGLALLVQAFR